MQVITDFSPYRSRQVPRKHLAQRSIAEQLAQSSNQYVPMKTGDLRSQHTIALDGSTITYHTPYAIYQYKKQYMNYTTPGTGPNWDKVAIRNHGDAIVKAGAKAW